MSAMSDETKLGDGYPKPASASTGGKIKQEGRVLSVSPAGVAVTNVDGWVYHGRMIVRADGTLAIDPESLPPQSQYKTIDVGKRT